MNWDRPHRTAKRSMFRSPCRYAGIRNCSYINCLSIIAYQTTGVAAERVLAGRGRMKSWWEIAAAGRAVKISAWEFVDHRLALLSRLLVSSFAAGAARRRWIYTISFHAWRPLSGAAATSPALLAFKEDARACAYLLSAYRRAAGRRCRHRTALGVDAFWRVCAAKRWRCCAASCAEYRRAARWASLKRLLVFCGI